MMLGLLASTRRTRGLRTTTSSGVMIPPAGAPTPAPRQERGPLPRSAPSRSWARSGGGGGGFGRFEGIEELGGGAVRGDGLQAELGRPDEREPGEGIGRRQPLVGDRLSLVVQRHLGGGGGGHEEAGVVAPRVADGGDPVAAVVHPIGGQAQQLGAADLGQRALAARDGV